MQTIPGSRCAAVLFDACMPFGSIVRALMDEIGLDYDEATAATLHAQRQLPSRTDTWSLLSSQREP